MVQVVRSFQMCWYSLNFMFHRSTDLTNEVFTVEVARMQNLYLDESKRAQHICLTHTTNMYILFNCITMFPFVFV